ncbi:MAG: glycosyltransferase family 39 protein, partial [Chloroflexi bacterium]|nr:glycosyltransferase family 39 protein [Chloroflexota bacterium]
YTFFWAFKLFGDKPASPKLLIIFFAVTCAMLIFFMGRMLFNDAVGMLGAFFYILGSSQFYLAGTTAEMEHFANLPMTATLFLFMMLLRKNARPLHFIWVGVLGAVCILYKIIFIAPLAAVGLAILLNAWIERRQAGIGKKTFAYIGAIMAGLLIPLLLVGWYFASLGLLQRFLLVFTFGFQYVDKSVLIGEVIFPKPFGFPLFMVAMSNIMLLFFGLFGTYRLLRRSIPLRTSENLMEFTLATWLIFSFAIAGFRGGGFQHYVLITIPPLALLGAIEISLTWQRWQSSASKTQATIGAGVMVALVFLNFLWRNSDLYREFIPDHPGAMTEFQTSQNNKKAVFEYIKANTTPGDFIYVWSINVQAYYYADRLPPIDILWPPYVSATGPPERIFDPRTKYIVVDDPKAFARPDWLIQGLEQYYVLEATINDLEIYRRIEG